MATRAQWAETLAPGLNAWIFEAANQLAPLYPNIFHVEKSQRSFEEEMASAGITKLLRRDEGKNTADKERVKAKATRYDHEIFSGKMKVTKEQYDDDLYSVFKRDARDLGYSGVRTFDFEAMSVFRNAFNTANTSYGDGLPLCSTAHTRADGGANQSNASSTGVVLNEANLETGALALREVLDDAGELFSIGDGSLILLVPPALRKTALILTQSDGRPSTANNDYNVYKGIYTVIETRWIGSLASGGSNTAWFLIDPMSHYLKFFMREAFNTEFKYEPENRTLFTYANARFSFGWSHWYGVWGSKGDGAAYSS